MTMFFRLKTSIVHERFGDETVIVNLDSGCYYSAQGTAELIWRLLESGLCETDIIGRMSAAYPDADKVAQHTADFLCYLLSEGLVDAATDAGNAKSDAAQISLGGESFVAPSLQKYSDMEELLQLDPIHEVDELGWPSTRK